jgi:hypothetical protein
MIDAPAHPTRSNSAKPRKFINRKLFPRGGSERFDPRHALSRGIVVEGFINTILRKKTELGLLGLWRVT